MNTAIQKEEDKIEYFDTPEDLEMKVEQLSLWIKEANHFVAFTGAGISTSAGISDFRSGVNTCLEVGPGVWEKAAKNIKNFIPKLSVASTKAFPTKCHMALLGLLNCGMLKHIISQNTDGLHRKSGVLGEQISELHGNTNKETCEKCKREYMRDFRVRNAQKVHDHFTGRYCDDTKCRGKLNDSIINFGESLPEKEVDMGFYNSAKADLHLCLGSSLRVQPAASMPEQTVNKGGKLVIINLQKTPLDNIASLVIHAKIDDVIDMLMQKLNLTLPKWRIQRHIHFNLSTNRDILNVEGRDDAGNPFSLFKSVKYIEENKTCVKEPHYIKGNFTKEYTIEFEFHGHYKEPKLQIKSNPKESRSFMYHLVYNPFDQIWEDKLQEKYD